MDEPNRLHPDDIEAIALRVAAYIKTSDTSLFLTAAEVAERIGFSEDWVYDHKVDLGAIPIGDGPKPRWRFPVTACDRYMADLADKRRERNAPKSRRRKPKGGHSAAGNPHLAVPKRVIPIS